MDESAKRLSSLIITARMKALDRNRSYSAAEDAIRTRALYNHYKEAVICQDTKERAH